MKDTAKARPATNGQLLELGNTISGKVVKLLSERGFSFDQSKFVIESVGKTKIADFIEQLTEGFFELAPVDATVRYKKDLETFFLKVYGLTIDLSDITFTKKGGREHYMVVPDSLDEDAVYAGFKTAGFLSSKYTDGSIVKKKSTEQSRPQGLYAFAHRGGLESDTEHLGKSYDQFSIDGQTYMTIKEYMLVYQFMYWKFKIRLDRKGWTRTTTLDSGGGIMCGYSYGGRFELLCGYRDGQGFGHAPRSVVVS